MSGVRIREELEGLGYEGGKISILDDLLRELQPRFLPPPRSFQRTCYRPGELAQFDLCEPRGRCGYHARFCPAEVFTTLLREAAHALVRAR